MDSHDRIIGRLEEFQRSAERRFDAIEEKVDALNQFKWRVAGGAAVLGVILGALGSFVSRIVTAKMGG